MSRLLYARARAFFRQVDWCLVLMMGPRHHFSPQQWQRLDQLAAISPTIQVAALLNVLLISWMAAMGLPAGTSGLVFLIALLLGVLTLLTATALWRRPTRRRLYLAYGLSAFPLGVVMGFVIASQQARWLKDQAWAHELMMRGMALGIFYSLSIWVVAMWRNEFLADWLQDEALREQKLELAQRLSSAQIQPHFLFNSLASLQHWVSVQDARAAPLLQSLTSYLRATLPLFDRPLLSVGEEAEAVQRYLEVMQARLGGRLCFALDIAPAAAAAMLPPGVLLTLVENAVEHGVQARLSGGEVQLRARLQADGGLCVEVLDDGPGPNEQLLQQQQQQHQQPDAAAMLQDANASLGLRNIRLRLFQAFGTRASLSLGQRPEGGCCAQVRVLPAIP